MRLWSWAGSMTTWWSWTPTWRVPPRPAFSAAEQEKGRPSALVLKTVKGKGVSFMENNAGWHGKAPNAEEFAIAKAELETKIKELEEN